MLGESGFACSVSVHQNTMGSSTSSLGFVLGPTKIKFFISDSTHNSNASSVSSSERPKFENDMNDCADMAIQEVSGDTVHPRNPTKPNQYRIQQNNNITNYVVTLMYINKLL